MATIREMHESIKTLNIESIAKDAIDDTSEELIAVNQEQLLDGKDKDGRDTKSLLWESYREQKRLNIGNTPYLNRNFTNYTMNYTGALFKSMRVVFYGRDIDVDSSYGVFDYYKRSYPNLFGFNENTTYMEYYRNNHLYPNMVLKIKQRIGL